MVSWNIDNHRRRAILEAKSIVQPHAGISTSGKVNLDDKLRKAEMHNVSITVNQNGTGDFKTIVKALKSIPPHNTRRFIIVIKPGVYRYVTCFHFSGDSIDPPIIIGNDTASSVSGKDGMPLKTFQSATVGVDANHFIAINMKFENTAPHEIGSKGGKAVALRMSGIKAAFYDCSFYGSQDTLLITRALFQQLFHPGLCGFHFRLWKISLGELHLNSIANKMASHCSKAQQFVIGKWVFLQRLCGDRSGLVYPGRAWGDYSRVVFSYTIVVKVVLPKESALWRVQVQWPGATFTGRVPWARILTDEEAMPFIETYYIDGDTWLITP
ncbi:hypothetical protein GH714_004757 [Hevea brasiliensis]|uniref:pectinesterase n=1 Tax=Hevea brasiliensis TaxID=3981 RepID=A0A6A6M8Z3_HEVBR|nr:hypothetical protein GH714_004757 [Hevea brasiliensis]